MKKSDQRKMVSFDREQPKSILVRYIGLYVVGNIENFAIFKLRTVGKVNGKLEILKLVKIPSKSQLVHSIVHIISPISFTTFQHHREHLASHILDKLLSNFFQFYQLNFQTKCSKPKGWKRIRPKIRPGVFSSIL